MSAQPEAWENGPERHLSLDGEALANAMQAWAYESSDKYRQRLRPDIGSTKDFETEDGSTGVLEWRAIHCYDDDGEYEGQRFTMSLNVTHSFENFIPEELRMLVLDAGDSLPDPDVVEDVEVEYEIGIYLDDKGKLEWAEDRAYSMTLVDATDDVRKQVLRNEEELEDDDVVVSHRSYRQQLGQYFEEAEKRRGTPENVTPISNDFLAFLGSTGLDGLGQDTYIEKANVLMGLLMAGHDAEPDLDDCFPADVVSAIKIGFNNPS